MKAERATVMQLLPQGSNANSRASSRANPRILTKRSFPAFRRERRHCFAHTRKKWRRNTENKERPSMTDFTCRVQPYLTQKQIGYTRHAEFRLTKNVHLYAGNLICACSGHYKHITWVGGFVFYNLLLLFYRTITNSGMH